MNLDFEIHLAWKVEHLQRVRVREMGGSPQPSTPHYKAVKLGIDQVHELIMTAQELLPFRANWPPVNEFVRLGGIPLLLQVIAVSYMWNFTGRAETVRSALVIIIEITRIYILSLLSIFILHYRTF